MALHKSSLLEALHAGTGRGRPSTLEACALFIAEASQAMQLASTDGESNAELHTALCTRLDWEVQRMLSPLLDYIKALPSGSSAVRRTATMVTMADEESCETSKTIETHLGAWATALQQEARKLGRSTAEDHITHALGLRRCHVCNTTLGTPLNMRSHIEGRRHCEAVARHHLRTISSLRQECGRSPDQPSDLAAVFEEHSNKPLRAAIAEPPDVALTALHMAFHHASSSARLVQPVVR